MKRTRRRALSILLSAAMVLSLSCVGAFAADTTLVITDVTTDKTTTTSAATHVTAVTYTENGEEKTVTAAADEVLTLVVNGVQRDIAAGATFTGVESYSFTDTAVRNSGSGAPPWEPGATPAEFNFRQALLVTADGIDQDASVTDAISGTYDDTSAKDVAVTSEGDFFNGIYVSGAQYAIDGLKMSLKGDGGNDFGGWGAGLMADGEADVTVDNAVIDTAGCHPHRHLGRRRRRPDRDQLGHQRL